MKLIGSVTGRGFMVAFIMTGLDSKMIATARMIFLVEIESFLVPPSKSFL